MEDRSPGAAGQATAPSVVIAPVMRVFNQPLSDTQKLTTLATACPKPYFSDWPSVLLQPSAYRGKGVCFAGLIVQNDPVKPTDHVFIIARVDVHGATNDRILVEYDAFPELVNRLIDQGVQEAPIFVVAGTIQGTYNTMPFVVAPYVN